MRAYQLYWNVIKVSMVDQLFSFFFCLFILQGTITYPTFGKGKSSTQKSFLGADMLARSQEGKCI